MTLAGPTIRLPKCTVLMVLHGDRETTRLANGTPGNGQDVMHGHESHGTSQRNYLHSGRARRFYSQ